MARDPMPLCIFLQTRDSISFFDIRHIGDSFSVLRLESEPTSRPNFIQFSADGGSLVVETTPVTQTDSGKIILADFKSFPR